MSSTLVLCHILTPGYMLRLAPPSPCSVFISWLSGSGSAKIMTVYSQYIELLTNMYEFILYRFEYVCGRQPCSETIVCHVVCQRNYYATPKIRCLHIFKVVIRAYALRYLVNRDMTLEPVRNTLSQVIKTCILSTILSRKN